jgi:FAD:protein FMN transferase
MAIVASKFVSMVATWTGLSVLKTLPDSIGSVESRFEFSQVHMGVEFKLTLYSNDLAHASGIAIKCFSKLRDLDDILSDYQQNSELNRVLRSAVDAPTTCSPTLFEVLQESRKLYDSTRGAFDATLGPLVALWRSSRKSHLLASLEEMVSSKSKTGWKGVVLDTGKRTLKITAGSKIDFGGIAKGYACDQVISILKKHRVTAGMIEGGGDLACIGAPPRKLGWEVKVERLPNPVILKNQAMSTSGSTVQFVEIEGRRFSHIIDPRTGLGLEHLRQVTVIAISGFTTDPWATALCINPRLKPPKGVRVIAFEGNQ